MIARIASDARIAENCDLRSLHLNGNNFCKSIVMLEILAAEIKEFLSLQLLKSLHISLFSNGTVFSQELQQSQITIFSSPCLTYDRCKHMETNNF